MADRRRPVTDFIDDGDKARADPDYLFFLNHVYPDGKSYVLEVPAADEVSPLVVIRYEAEVPAAAAAADDPGGAEVEGVVEREAEPAPVVIDQPLAKQDDDRTSISSFGSSAPEVGASSSREEDEEEED